MKLGAILEQLHLELRMAALKLRQAAEVIGVRAIKKFQRMERQIGLFPRGRRVNGVMRGFELEK